MKARWMKSVVKNSQQETAVMPFHRNLRQYPPAKTKSSAKAA